MRKSEARAANGKIVPVNHQPLREPALAAKYAEILRDGFSEVFIRTKGDRIEVIARHAK